MSSISGDLEFEPQYLTAPADIYLHLVRLRKSKAVILVSIGGDRLYRTSLLQIDRDHGLVAVDEVVPLDGNRLLAVAGGLTLSAQSDAGPSFWHVPAGAVRGGVLEGLPCHWLPLPAEIRYMQRRRSFRASFLIGQAPPLTILDEDGRDVIVGEMLDISEHGCRFMIRAAVPPQWAALGFRLPVRIGPQGPAGFELVGEVRHAAELTRGEAFMVGLLFVDVVPAVTRHLSQLVVQAQRARRRQQLELE
ncbi:flagellar brake protein [Frateuria aurantia]